MSVPSRILSDLFKVKVEPETPWSEERKELAIKWILFYDHYDKKGGRKSRRDGIPSAVLHDFYADPEDRIIDRSGPVYLRDRLEMAQYLGIMGGTGTIEVNKNGGDHECLNEKLYTIHFQQMPGWLPGNTDSIICGYTSLYCRNVV